MTDRVVVDVVVALGIGIGIRMAAHELRPCKNTSDPRFFSGGQVVWRCTRTFVEYY